MTAVRRTLPPLLLACLAAPAAAAPQRAVELAAATIVTAPDASAVEKKAVEVLVEEVERRTGVRLAVVQAWPAAAKAVIAVGTAAGAAKFAGPLAPGLSKEPPTGSGEGYRLRVEQHGKLPVVLLVGNEPRGALFAVGRFLRAASWGPRALSLDPTLNVFTSPKVGLRGHQLGFGPRVSCYDGWSADAWSRYVRELALFGANAVELVPPADGADREARLASLQAAARAAAAYGLLVSLQIPVPPDGKPETAVRAWEGFWRKLPRLDGLFVALDHARPMGGAAHYAFVERLATAVRAHHRSAKLWLTPPEGDDESLEGFFSQLGKEPAWLGGVVYEPRAGATYGMFRRRSFRINARYQPELGRAHGGRLPVPAWDRAFALTASQLPIDPRPAAMAELARSIRRAAGFVSRSEGCHDDVNKVVWTALAWDDDTDLMELLRQYARLFVSPRADDAFAHALVGLERNWRGPLLANDEVYPTLRRLQEIERLAGPEALGSWRFQQALYRGYQDAYLRARLLHETSVDEQALARLRAAGDGVGSALDEAEEVLARGARERVGADWRARLGELASALAESAKMRVPVADLDAPLGQRAWLKRRFSEIRAMRAEADRARAVAALLDWTSAGAGGFHDDPGNPGAQPRLVRKGALDGEPGFIEPGLTAISRVAPDSPPAWRDCALAAADREVELRYTGLDPRARYRVRVVYVGEQGSRVKLTADERPVHPPLPTKLRPLEFDLPDGVTRDGDLTLSWHHGPEPGGDCQLAEVWLLRR